MTQHQRFLQRLRESKCGVAAVAYWLFRRNNHVELEPTRYAPTPGDGHFSDKGDLFRHARGRRRRWEVKTLFEIVFTCAADYPHRDMFIASVANVEKYGHEVERWAIVSADLNTVAILDPATKPLWRIVEKEMPNTGNMERKYACDPELFVYYRMDLDEDQEVPAENPVP